MASQDIDVLLENQSLKFEFHVLNLDLSQVFWATPDDLERENRFLHHLLDWVQRYSECEDRTIMETEGYDFPPIEPDISPENDWYRFELWMQGRAICQKLKDQLPRDYTPRSLEHLSDEEIISELQALSVHLANLQVVVDFQEDVPPRLAYAQLLEMLEDEFEIIEAGFWHLDGCSGYCPGCFQRPWCETGSQSCWPEDEQAGKMVLIESVQSYVSASPMSLPLLEKFQAEADRELAEFKQDHNSRDPVIDPSMYDLDDDELPF